MAKRFWNEKELEEYTGVKKTTLQRWRLIGKGPKFVKLHGAVKYDVRDVEKWLESCGATAQTGLSSVAGGAR